MSDASEDLIRIQTRLDDQSAAMETRTRAIEESVRGLEKSLAESHFNAQQAVQRSLSELQTRYTEASGELRTTLVERFEDLKKDVGAQLGDGRVQSNRSMGELREQMQLAFDRFQTRMDNLSRHIKQANKDVDEVHTSAQKISNRFEKIENVDLEHESPPALEQDRKVEG